MINVLGICKRDSNGSWKRKTMKKIIMEYNGLRTISKPQIENNFPGYQRDKEFF